jgi:hypothetical protein
MNMVFFSCCELLSVDLNEEIVGRVGAGGISGRFTPHPFHFKLRASSSHVQVTRATDRVTAREKQRWITHRAHDHYGFFIGPIPTL